MLLNLLVNTNDLFKAFEIFWKGMLAVAIVICIIVVITILMNKCSDNFSSRKQKKENDGSEDATLND